MDRDLTERISARIIKSNSIGKITAPLDTFLQHWPPPLRGWQIGWISILPRKLLAPSTASVNVSATILFLISFLMRWDRHWQPRWATLVVALAGYLLVMIGGYLGGALVFYKGGQDQPQCIETWPR